MGLGKMKLQRTSLALLLSAALLAGGVVIYEARKPGPTASQMSDQAASQKVFDFAESAIVFLTIETNALGRSNGIAATPTAAPTGAPSSGQLIQAVSLERVNGQWALSAPLQAPANAATVLFLTNLLTTAQRDRTLEVSRDRAAEFGFDAPQATIDITLADQTKHQLVLGKLSFDRTFLYAQIDPDANAKTLSVSLISPQFANAVNRELKEWQATAKSDRSAVESKMEKAKSTSKDEKFDDT
jgi:hypothetical protein